MPLHSYSTEGIILARRTYGEADRIITVFTRDFGKATYIAKGIRRPSSKKRGHLEIFNIIKFSASKSMGMDMIVEVEAKDSFEDIRSSLKKVSVAYYLVEIVNRITNEQESHPEIFELTSRYLEILKVATSLKKLRLDFAYQALVHLGYWPKGVVMDDPNAEIEKVIERTLGSVRVGKKVLS